MNSSISIDISLLAILFALHFTANPKTQNFKLLILVVLFAHVVFTTNGMYKDKEEVLPLGMENTVDEDEEDDFEIVNKHDDEIPNETENVIRGENVPIVRKNTSDGEFNRNFSTPSTSAVLFSPNPVVSDNVNSKLSNSRNKFFSDILGSGIN